MQRLAQIYPAWCKASTISAPTLSRPWPAERSTPLAIAPLWADPIPCSNWRPRHWSAGGHAMCRPGSYWAPAHSPRTCHGWLSLKTADRLSSVALAYLLPGYTDTEAHEPPSCWATMSGRASKAVALPTCNASPYRILPAVGISGTQGHTCPVVCAAVPP